MQLMKLLCESYGPTGREEKIRKIIQKEIRSLVESVKIDTMGNLIARYPGKGKKVMVCAHMDEVGIIVSYIDRKGFLRFAPVGGVYPNRLVALRVVFENGVNGVVYQETKGVDDKPLKFDKLFIDIGASDLKSAEKLVKVGDIAAFHQNFQIMGNRIVAKALDDRIGCYILIEVLKNLKRIKPKNNPDIYFVWTVQEEVGLRGAITSSYGITPDYGLAVDVTATGDTPETEKMAVELGMGVAIKIKDRMMISHPRIRDLLIEIARRNKIPYQYEILEWGTTDSAVLQISKTGVRSGAISIPCRYIHTTSEMVDKNDVTNAISLLTKFLLHRLR